MMVNRLGGMMKILMTTDNFGDAWYYSTELAGKLRKKGLEITLAIIGNPLSDQQKKQLDGIAYFNLECKLEWMKDPWPDMQIAKEWLLKIVKILQPDIVHMNTYAMGDITDNIPVIVNINFLGFNRWKAVLHKSNYSDLQFYEEKISETLKSAHMIIAPDKAMMKETETLFGNFKKKRLMYCGKERPLFSQNLRDKDPTNQKSLEEYQKAKMINEYTKLYHNTREYSNKFILYSVLSN